MKKIDTSSISNTAGMPAKAGVLNHLMQAYQEALQALSNSLIGNEYDATKVYVLYGCLNSGTSPAFIISAGAIFFNGEIYLVPAISFTISGNVAIGNIATAFATSAIGDPIQFTDGASHNVLQIRTAAISAGTTGTGTLPDFSAWLRVPPVAMQNTITATLPSTYTISFLQDQANFFTAAYNTSGNLTWNFVGAIPGVVVRSKITLGASGSITILTPGGMQIYAEGGSLQASKTNIMYATYLGKNESGNDEVSYNVKSF